jgi:hypothetical protein
MESSLDAARPYAIRFPNWFHSVVHSGVFAIASIVIECVVQVRMAGFEPASMLSLATMHSLTAGLKSSSRVIGIAPNLRP